MTRKPSRQPARSRPAPKVPESAPKLPAGVTPTLPASHRHAALDRGHTGEPGAVYRRAVATCDNRCLERLGDAPEPRTGTAIGTG